MSTVSITPSDVLEFLYCKRFIYFMHALNIPQHEGKRYKVMKGRGIHEKKLQANPHYSRKRLNVVKKETNCYLASEKYSLRGIVDEVLYLDNGEAAPFDYKFASYKGRLYSTYRVQLYLYGLLIEENFHSPVSKGYICYTRSNNKIVEVVFNKEGKKETLDILSEMKGIAATGYFPKATKDTKKCIDCCYRRICVH